MVISNKRMTTTHILLVLILVVMFIPISFSNVRVMGMVLTSERLLIPVLALLAFLNRFSLKTTTNRTAVEWIVFFVVWIAIGFFLMFSSEYVKFNDGLKEMLSIILAFLTSYLLINIFKEKEYITFSINVVKAILVVSIVFALFEIITNKHLPTSYFTLEPVLYMNKGATFFYYGVNDFSSFITLLCPVFFFTNKTIRHNVFSTICLLLIFYINTVNDARFCILAMLLGFVIALLLVKKMSPQKVLVIIICLLLFLSFIYILHEYTSYNSIFISTFQEKLQDEIFGFYRRNGSVYLRLMTYLESFIASSQNFFFGYGPDSFRNYFTAHPSASSLVNPHSMFLEVLFNYGLIIMLLLVYFIFKLIKYGIKYFKQEGRIEYVIVVVMMFAYIIVSFAPSNFISYSYQWYPFVLGVCLLNGSMKYKRNRQIEHSNLN